MPISSNLSSPVRAGSRPALHPVSIRYSSSPSAGDEGNARSPAAAGVGIAPAAGPAHAVIGQDQHVLVGRKGLAWPR